MLLQREAVAPEQLRRDAGTAAVRAATATPPAGPAAGRRRRPGSAAPPARRRRAACRAARSAPARRRRPVRPAHALPAALPDPSRRRRRSSAPAATAPDPAVEVGQAISSGLLSIISAASASNRRASTVPVLISTAITDSASRTSTRRALSCWAVESTSRCSASRCSWRSSITIAAISAARAAATRIVTTKGRYGHGPSRRDGVSASAAKVSDNERDGSLLNGAIRRPARERGFPRADGHIKVRLAREAPRAASGEAGTPRGFPDATGRMHPAHRGKFRIKKNIAYLKMRC
jgi:hypothetical protein